MNSIENDTDPSVDAIVARAAQAAALPTGEHNKLYSSLLTDLEQALDAGPETSISGTDSHVERENL